MQNTLQENSNSVKSTSAHASNGSVRQTTASFQHRQCLLSVYKAKMQDDIKRGTFF